MNLRRDETSAGRRLAMANQVEVVFGASREDTDQDDAVSVDADHLCHRGGSLFIPHDQIRTDDQVNTGLEILDRCVSQALTIRSVIIDPEIPVHRGQFY